MAPAVAAVAKPSSGQVGERHRHRLGRCWVQIIDLFGRKVSAIRGSQSCSEGTTCLCLSVEPRSPVCLS